MNLGRRLTSAMPLIAVRKSGSRGTPAFANKRHHADSPFSHHRTCLLWFRSDFVVQPGQSGELAGPSHAAGYAIRQKRRCPHRLPVIWRWSDQSGYGSGVRVERRELLGPARSGSLFKSSGQLRPRGNLRQARDRHVRSGGRASRS